jgi:hypothetical protein
MLCVPAESEMFWSSKYPKLFSLNDPPSKSAAVPPLNESVTVTVPVGLDPVSLGAHGVETTIESDTTTVKI